MLKDRFDSIQCLIFCNIFPNVLQPHFVCIHFNLNNLNDKEREEFFKRQNNFSLQKLKCWLEREEISEPKVVPKLKN